jgi:hypothetical protein
VGLQTKIRYAGFEVLTAVEMKISVFSACNLLHVGFLLGLFFDPGDRGDISLQNVDWLSTVRHCFIFQKIKLFENEIDKHT